MVGMESTGSVATFVCLDILNLNHSQSEKLVISAYLNKRVEAME